MAAVRVPRPSRKLNSTAAAIEAPIASAAAMVTRLRLTPGQRARISAAPMIAAWRTVNDVSPRSPRPRVPPHEERTADEPGGDDGPRAEQLILDRVAGEHADRSRGHEGDQQPDQQATTVGVASDGTGGELAEPPPVQHDDREDGPDLDGDRVRVGGQLAVAVTEVEEPLDDEQVPGRRHGQVLGESLDGAQDDRFERRERPCGVRATATPPPRAPPPRRPRGRGDGSAEQCRGDLRRRQRSWMFGRGRVDGFGVRGALAAGAEVLDGDGDQRDRPRSRPPPAPGCASRSRSRRGSSRAS